MFGLSENDPQMRSGTSREELIMEIPVSSPAEDKSNSDEDGEEEEEDEEEAEAWWEGTEMGEDIIQEQQKTLGENADENNVDVNTEVVAEDTKNTLPVSIMC